MADAGVKPVQCAIVISQMYLWQVRSPQCATQEQFRISVCLLDGSRMFITFRFSSTSVSIYIFFYQQVTFTPLDGQYIADIFLFICVFVCFISGAFLVLYGIALATAGWGVVASLEIYPPFAGAAVSAITLVVAYAFAISRPQLTLKVQRQLCHVVY